MAFLKSGWVADACRADLKGIRNAFVRVWDGFSVTLLLVSSKSYDDVERVKIFYSKRG
jgi:hypothetical protein